MIGSVVRSNTAHVTATTSPTSTSALSLRRDVVERFGDASEIASDTTRKMPVRSPNHQRRNAPW